MTVMRRLGAISRLGYLDLVEPGIPGTRATGKANTWRWHDPPRPGETVWNSNDATRRPVEEAIPAAHVRYDGVDVESNVPEAAEAEGEVLEGIKTQILAASDRIAPSDDAERPAGAETDQGHGRAA